MPKRKTSNNVIQRLGDWNARRMGVGQRVHIRGIWCGLVIGIAPGEYHYSEIQPPDATRPGNSIEMRGLGILPRTWVVQLLDGRVVRWPKGCDTSPCTCGETPRDYKALQQALKAERDNAEQSELDAMLGRLERIQQREKE